jgi:glycosyltransferase involved in cell wall biosynthesis
MDVDEEKVKADYGIPADAPLILFAGRLTYQKGPDLLLDAIPKVLKNRSDSRFVFVGDGNMHGELKDRTLASRGSTRFLGYLPDEEFVRLLNACDICAIPSRNEPFGLVLLEAWSAEKSVVATDVGGLSENIENYVDGVKVPVDTGGIARGINNVIDGTIQLSDMGKNGKKKIEDEFRWHVIAKKMMREYSAVLN